MEFFNTPHPALNLALERAYRHRGPDGDGSLRELSEAIDAVVDLLNDSPTAQAAPAAGAVAGPVKQCAGIPRPGCDYMAECGSVCRKCGKVHSAHLLMFDTPQPRWVSYEVAVSDPVFQVARSIMGTENIGQDRQLVAAINHVLAAAPTPAAQADSGLVEDAARYRWLRDGNAYVPEEEMVRGGDELDALCDAARAAQKENGQ